MDFNKAYQLVTEKLSGWIQELIRLLPNILLATLVLVLGIFVARKIKQFSVKLINRISGNSTLNTLFGSIVHIFFIGIVLFAVLSILGFDKAVTSVLAGIGILGLGLALAFQDIAANFISGIFISFRKPFHIGDIVKIGDYMGKVREINLRDTVLLTFQGQIVILPNKDVFQNPIENYSMLGKRRLDLVVGVSYGEDLEKVRTITLDAVKDIEGLNKEDETTMYYQEFADSSINYIIRLWISSPEQAAYWHVSNQAVMRIKKAYDNNNITIPFPIRTLDFGIKGGVPLNEVNLRLADKNVN
ncbi:MAG: mechanosensitive ion channel family protein [Chitinophagaceae bacterium]